MSTRPNRETAYRVFAAEFEDATFSYTESDEERAPNYVLTPTGARINRLFTVGVLTEIESVNDEQLRARVVDPTGAFVVYAGQYQPEALSFLERAETPTFVAVTGKARTFQPEDSNRVFTSIRPETLSEVDAATRDRFTVDTAERTAERVRTMQDALERDERGDALREALEAEDVETGLAAGIPRAIEHYGTTRTYLDALNEMALDAARVVAGERDAVSPLDVAPGEGGSTERGEPVTADEPDVGAEPAASAAEATETRAESTAETVNDEAVVADDDAGLTIESESTSGSAAASDGESESGVEAESSPEIDESTTEVTTESERLAAGVEDEETADTSAEIAHDDPEEFELDEEVQEEIEEQYGTDFESAAEVDGPGKADIETPTPAETSTESGAEVEESAGTADTSAAESSGEIEPTAGDVSTDETTETDTTEGTEATESADDASDDESETDPEAAVVAAMHELDDGDGADREAIIEQVTEDDGLTREEAEDGIQSALLSGECYEPEDDIFKPI